MFFCLSKPNCFYLFLSPQGIHIFFFLLLFVLKLINPEEIFLLCFPSFFSQWIYLALSFFSFSHFFFHSFSSSVQLRNLAENCTLVSLKKYFPSQQFRWNELYCQKYTDHNIFQGLRWTALESVLTLPVAQCYNMMQAFWQSVSKYFHSWLHFQSLHWLLLKIQTQAIHFWTPSPLLAHQFFKNLIIFLILKFP